MELEIQSLLAFPQRHLDFETSLFLELRIEFPLLILKENVLTCDYLNLTSSVIIIRVYKCFLFSYYAHMAQWYCASLEKHGFFGLTRFLTDIQVRFLVWAYIWEPSFP